MKTVKKAESDAKRFLRETFPNRPKEKGDDDAYAAVLVITRS